MTHKNLIATKISPFSVIFTTRARVIVMLHIVSIAKSMDVSAV